jgi:phosphoribosylglycinamide formyltransferase 2
MSLTKRFPHRNNKVKIDTNQHLTSNSQGYIMKIGTPLSPTGTRVLFCGGGELAKEVVIELQRLGVEVIVVDRYENAPAMQVAHRSHVINMLDGNALREIINVEQPHYIVPEIEAIATRTLVELESEGFNVIPSARAAHLTMNREGIRRLAAEELGLATSPFRFAESKDEYLDAVKEIGIPCVVKPIMSSSGKGQSTIHSEADIENTWNYAQEGGRTGQGKVIVEGFIEFDYEITLLTVRHANGTSFCEPIGHVQVDGDYRESWQPQAMSQASRDKAINIARTITDNLGGWGIFGVELFIKGDEVYFSEVSPRPHDTGLVTLISQDLSEFALHARAILGLPIPHIRQYGYSASSVILVNGESSQVKFGDLDVALAEPDTQLRLFGKPKVKTQRRMGVMLALGDSIEQAREKATKASKAISIQL